MSTVFRVEKTANYTVMSNYHLKDRRLSYKAKGLLSEMLSLPPDWDYTLSGLAVIANDGIDSVRSAVKELEKYGYLVRYQRRDERGRMSVNEYTVYENPEQNPDYKPSGNDEIAPGKSKSRSVKRKSPSLENPATDVDFSHSPSLENPITVNSSTEKSSAGTYNKLNTNKSNHSIFRAPRGDENDGIDVHQEENYSSSEREFYREMIRENIDYDYFYENRKNPKSPDIKRIDELVSIMTDVVCSKRKTVRANGEDLPQKSVKERFLCIDSGHIEYVLDALDKNTTAIKNIRAYLITTLYNAPETIDSYFTGLVNHDLYDGRR